jgi:hypothetical protein
MQNEFLGLITITLMMIPALVKPKYARIIIPILFATGAILYYQISSLLDFIFLVVLPSMLSVCFALIIPRRPWLACASATLAVAVITALIPTPMGKMFGGFITFIFALLASIFSCGLASWLWHGMIRKPPQHL